MLPENKAAVPIGNTVPIPYFFLVKIL